MKGPLILLAVSPLASSLTGAGFARWPNGVILEPEKHGVKRL
jgi:hypothetical protein